MKICIGCKQNREFSCFNKNKRHSSGFEAKCKECRHAIYTSKRIDILAGMKAKYDANPQKYKDIKKASYAGRADQVNLKRRIQRSEDPSVRINQKLGRRDLRTRCIEFLGNKCIGCNEIDPDTFCIDHVNDDGQQERANGLSPVTMFRRILRGEEFGRYQILCFNCNFKKGLFREKIRLDLNVMKKCSTCLMMLDVANFKKHNGSDNGFYNECRKCCFNRNLALKVDAFGKLGSFSCMRCKSDDFYTLTVDHILDDGSVSRSNEGLGISFYRKILRDRLDTNRYQVLCFNCNLKKHICKLKEKAFDVSSLTKDVVPTKKVKFNFDDVEVSMGGDPIHPMIFIHQNHPNGYGHYGFLHISCHVSKKLAAVIRVSAPTYHGSVTSIKYQINEVLELDRLCIAPEFEGKSHKSKFLDLVVSCIHERFPGIRALIAQVDPDNDPTGQACVSAGWEDVTSRNKYQYDRKSPRGSRPPSILIPERKFLYTF